MTPVTITALLLAVTSMPAHMRGSRDAGPSFTSPAIQRRDTFEVGMLRVEHSGTRGRPPLIFIPALFCGSSQWERELTALADRYDLYALTLPGFDGRPRDTGGDLMSRAVSDIASLIASHHLDRPVLIGHSLGGTLAVLFAESHRTAIRGVIAVEGGYPVAPTPAQRERIVAASTEPYVGLNQAAFGDTLRTRMLQYVVTRPADVRRLEVSASRSDPAAVVDWMRAALLLDLTPGLARLTVPLTEIVPFDPMIDPHQGFSSLAAKRAAYQTWVAHDPRGGTVAMVTPSRHFVMLDQPQKFDRLLFRAIEGALTHPAAIVGLAGFDSAGSATVTASHDTFTIASHALREQRVINVWTPSAYRRSGPPLQVLYMPDGGIDEDFPHVVHMVDSLARAGAIRPAIVVGIPNTQRRRDLTGPTRVKADSAIAPQIGGSADFRKFIHDELIPEVTKRYRVSEERAIIGESLAGLFVLETLLEQPSLFTHYAALDPSFWWNDGALVESASSRLRTLNTKRRTLYLATADVRQNESGPQKFVDALRMSAPASLRWIYRPRPDLTHATIFLGTEADAIIHELR